LSVLNCVLSGIDCVGTRGEGKEARGDSCVGMPFKMALSAVS